MRHLDGNRKLGRKSAHRKALLRNLATSLVIHERIDTTLPKAKELRGVVDRLITLGKRGDLTARRLAAAWFFNDEAVSKVFTNLASRFKDRPGGYTRILRRGVRHGDAADMATIELVDYGNAGSSEASSTKGAKKSEAKKAPAKKAASK